MLFKLTPLLLLMTFTINAKSIKLDIERKRLSSRGAEYISGDHFDTAMIQVNMIGSVQKPGTHLVPRGTTLSGILSYAGGPTKEANLEEIQIKTKNKSLDFNFDSYMAGERKDYNLKTNDYILIKKKEQFWDNRTLSIVSTFLGIIVSGIIIEDKL